MEIQETMKTFEHRQFELWAAGDKQAWLEHLSTVPLKVEYRIKEPHGDGAIAVDVPPIVSVDYLDQAWDESHGGGMRCVGDPIIVSGTDIAVAVHCSFEVNGEERKFVSLEFFHVDDNDVVVWRAYWDPGAWIPPNLAGADTVVTQQVERLERLAERLRARKDLDNDIREKKLEAIEQAKAGVHASVKSPAV